METLPTGISVLDREFGGGLPSGSVVVLKADPASQSELIVDRFSRPRACRYLTTVRSADAVKAILTLGGESEGDGSGGDAETVVEETDREDPIDDVLATASDLPEGATPSSTPSSRWRRLTGRGTVRFSPSSADTSMMPAGSRWCTLSKGKRAEPSGHRQVADVIFDLRTTVTGTEIVNRLIVPKFRGGAALEEPLKLKLTDTVSVDTSRDIA